MKAWAATWKRQGVQISLTWPIKSKNTWPGTLKYMPTRKIISTGDRDQPEWTGTAPERSVLHQTWPPRSQNERSGRHNWLAYQNWSWFDRKLHQLLIWRHQPRRQPGKTSVGKGWPYGLNSPSHPDRNRFRYTIERGWIPGSIWQNRRHRVCQRLRTLHRYVGQDGCWKTGKEHHRSQLQQKFRQACGCNPNTFAFVGSPEMVTAMATAGPWISTRSQIRWPTIKANRSSLIRPWGDELPVKGFAVEDAGYQAPAPDGSKVEVKVAPDSKRLQLLEPFATWEGTDLKRT